MDTLERKKSSVITLKIKKKKHTEIRSYETDSVISPKSFRKWYLACKSLRSASHFFFLRAWARKKVHIPHFISSCRMKPSENCQFHENRVFWFNFPFRANRKISNRQTSKCVQIFLWCCVRENERAREKRTPPLAPPSQSLFAFTL